MRSLNHILLARDFSSGSDRAMQYALDLAARTEATLHLLHADVLHAAEGETDPSKLTEDLDALGGTLSKPIDDISTVEAVRRDVAPGPAILSYADEHDIDLIAMGTHGRRGAHRLLLGSVAEEVVRRAQQPVLTVRGPDDTQAADVGTLRRILVPLDFSDPSREALRTAHEWAALYGAEIDVLHVIEEDMHPAFYVGGVSSIYDVEPNLNEKVRSTLNDFVEEVLGPTDRVTPHVRTGAAASVIATFVDDHAVDLVALSTHGRTGLKRFFLGSVAEKVARHVPCPVLTLKTFGTSLLSSASAAPTA